MKSDLVNLRSQISNLKFEIQRRASGRGPFLIQPDLQLRQRPCPVADGILRCFSQFGEGFRGPVRDEERVITEPVASPLSKSDPPFATAFKTVDVRFRAQSGQGQGTPEPRAATLCGNGGEQTHDRYRR